MDSIGLCRSGQRPLGVEGHLEGAERMGQAEPPCAVDLRAAAVGWRHLRQIGNAADRVCNPRLMD